MTTKQLQQPALLFQSGFNSRPVLIAGKCLRKTNSFTNYRFIQDNTIQMTSSILLFT